MTQPHESTEAVIHSRLIKVLELIMILSQGRHDVHYLAWRLDTSTRTVYRYFTLIQEVGFKVSKELQKPKPPKYFLESWPAELLNIKMTAAA